MRFQLERNVTPLGEENAGTARDRLPYRCRRQVADLDLRSHGALARLEQGQDRRPGSVLQEPNQPGSGKHRGHASFGKINRMAGLDDEPHFAERAGFGEAFHASFKVSRPSSSELNPRSSRLPRSPWLSVVPAF